MLVLIGVAAAFRTAFLPHTKSSVASKLAQTNHPVAVPPAQWLPVFLAASTPGPPTHHRRLGEVTLITTKAQPHFLASARPGAVRDTRQTQHRKS